MITRWTDSLAPPLSQLAAGRDWMRIQKSRRGWWLLAQSDRGGERWFHADDESLEPQPASVFDDERLATLRKVVGGWLAQGDPVRLLAWRPGKRAVFRVGTPEQRRICKLYRRDRDYALRWTALADQRDGRWRSPAVLDWDRQNLCLTIEDCPGRSLNQRWLAGEGRESDADRIAELLGWLAATTPPPALPVHGVEDEIAILEKRIASFEKTLEQPPPTAAELTGRVVAALRNESRVAPIFSHRDLHDKQVLLDGSAGYLIDLDLVALAPPALDPGNLLAHLRLRALQGSQLPWRAIVARTVRLTAGSRDAESSLGTWVAAALLRLGLIYARRRHQPGLLAGLLESSAQALERRGEWIDLG